MGTSFTPEQSKQLMDLARATILAVLRGQAMPALDGLDPALHQPAGCFVTLSDAQPHRLRGCIGTFETERPLSECVRQMSVGTLRDPRFVNNPVLLDDLPNLMLDINVLAPRRPAENVLDFDLQNDGIYLIFGDRQGCFLPTVARSTGWTKEQLLDRLCMEKMGLSPLVWKNPHAKLFKFATVEIGPEKF